MEARRLALLRMGYGQAAIDDRERLLALACVLAPRSDLVVLTTCHRVELYVAPGHAAEEWFATILGPGAGDLAARAVLERDESVVRHLLRTACGLDSVVRGEGQILGQLRRTYDDARTRELDPLLAALFQHALRVARDVRASTSLNDVRRSVGTLAVEEAIRHLARPDRSRVLVVGAGEMGKATARAVARRVASVVIANRDVDRAVALARDLEVEAIPLDDLDRGLAGADVVISAADTRGEVLTVSRLRRRLDARPLVLVDIAVPRSVARDARALAGLTYRCVDDLRDEPDPAIDGALAEAERRCVAEARAFLERRRERAAAETIRALRGRAERVRRERLERALARLRHLAPRDRRIVEALSSSVTNALIHPPTVALRRAPEHARAAEELFGLAEDA